MIKQNELRVGNIVRKKRVEYIADFITIKCADNYNPIPITAKILKRIKFTGIIFPAQLIINNSGKYYWGNGINVEIKYLHQLQNLHFALTGKELEIK